jgi:hypothetical protein
LELLRFGLALALQLRLTLRLSLLLLLRQASLDSLFLLRSLLLRSLLLCSLLLRSLLFRSLLLHSLLLCSLLLFTLRFRCSCHLLVHQLYEQLALIVCRRIRMYVSIHLCDLTIDVGLLCCDGDESGAMSVELSRIRLQRSKLAVQRDTVLSGLGDLNLDRLQSDR